MPPVDEIAADYETITTSNWYTNYGPFSDRLSNALVSYLNDAVVAVTFCNATTALMSAIHATLGRGDGDAEVLMPSFTFAAGADAVIWCGYRPRFVDIDPQNLHMDLAAAREVLDESQPRSKIAGMLFCNTFGVGARDIEDWEALAAEYGLPLLIDSAAGFGSDYSEHRKVGTAGSCEIFSFHATKPFAIGEGGALITRDQSLADEIVSVQNFGFEPGERIARLGLNGKMQELNAAIALRQLARLDTAIANRRLVFSEYQEKLAVRGFSFQDNAENASLCFATLLASGPEHRDEALAQLEDAGVVARSYYRPALHQQPFFQQYGPHGPLPITESVVSRVISVPIHDAMARVDIDRVIAAISE